MAPQIVWCDAKDCIYHDEERGECDVYRLRVEGGVCVGHPRSGRNVTSNDVVERLKDENEKLRELAMRFADYVGQDRCEGCVTKTRCNEGLVDECLLLTEIRKMADGLGIEVD